MKERSNGVYMQKVHIPILVFLFSFCIMTQVQGEQGLYLGRVKPPTVQKIVIANSTEPASFDPAVMFDTVSVQIGINIYEGLFSYDPKTNETIPRIAQKWAIHENGLLYIFYLRHDARFSNGDPVTAHDFVYGWKRALHPKAGASMANLMYSIKNAKAYNQGEPKIDERAIGIRALDDFTLQVELDRPNALFIKFLPHPLFSPVHRRSIEVAEEKGLNYFTPQNLVKNFIGNGAFILSEWKMYDKIILKKNPYYWGRDSIVLEEAEYVPIEDLGAVMNLYKAGDLDVLIGGQIPPAFVRALKGKKDFYQTTALGTLYLSFNTQRDYGKNTLFKESIQIGINKEEICHLLNLVPAMTLVPPFKGYTHVTTVKYDPEKARNLFNQSGIDPKTSITLLAPHNDRDRLLLEALQGVLKQQFGLENIQLSFQEYKVFVQSVLTKDFDGARIRWIADYVDPLAFLEVLLSYNINNFTGWTNTAYDVLLEKSSEELEEHKRFHMLEEAESILLKELPIIPLCYYSNSILMKPYVQGWYNNALDIHPLNEASINTNWAQ